jgi:tRNA pseudouridine38-40 synthase
MRTLKLTIAYDGTRFVGWQRQAQGASIQGLLEAALSRLEPASAAPDGGGGVTVHGAGRTDAGVHALGQVASVSLTCSHDAPTIARAINAQLPDDVRVMAAEEMPPDFHARFGARGKTYRYLIAPDRIVSPFLARFAWHVTERLDVEAMARAAAVLVGTHDFAAFQSTGGDTTTSTRTLTQSDVRIDEAGFPARGRTIVYEVSGDGFLRHMVRAIVGTLVEVGRGQRSPESMHELLASGSRAAAGPTAPAQGLFLVEVRY